MKKRYLKTVEDVLALNDTDTKIYEEHSTWHYKFVKGVLCRFNSYNGVTYFNCKLNMEEDIYIFEEEPKQEANQVIKAFRKENWRYGGEFIGVSSSYSCAQSYLDKWGVK